MKKIFIAVLLSTVVIYGGIQSANASAVIDDFNDGILNSNLWTIDSTGSISIQETGGVVTAISPPLSGTYDIGWLNSNLVLSGDFDVSFDYQWINGVGASRTRTQMFIFDETESESFALNFWRGGGFPDGDLIYSHSSGGQIGHSWNPPATGKLRIRRQNQNFAAYYWSGGWASLGSQNGFGGDAHFGINANVSRYNSGSPLNVRWDNVSITADGISSVPIPSAVLLLGSSLIALVGYAQNHKKASKLT